MNSVGRQAPRNALYFPEITVVLLEVTSVVLEMTIVVSINLIARTETNFENQYFWIGLRGRCFSGMLGR